MMAHIFQVSSSHYQNPRKNRTTWLRQNLRHSSQVWPIISWWEKSECRKWRNSPVLVFCTGMLGDSGMFSSISSLAISLSFLSMNTALKFWKSCTTFSMFRIGSAPASPKFNVYIFHSLEHAWLRLLMHEKIMNRLCTISKDLQSCLNQDKWFPREFERRNLALKGHFSPAKMVAENLSFLFDRRFVVESVQGSTYEDSW